MTTTELANKFYARWKEQGMTFTVEASYWEGKWYVWIPEEIWQQIRPGQRFYPGPIQVPADSLRISNGATDGGIWS